MSAVIIELDVGEDVLCDFCGGDFTKSDAIGGLLFCGKAVCPSCAPETEADAKDYDEEPFITARCPEGKIFAEWVRELRARAVPA